MTDKETSNGRVLLNAVERMLDTPDEITKIVDRIRADASGDLA